jgi:hypothetical protein
MLAKKVVLNYFIAINTNNTLDSRQFFLAKLIISSVKVTLKKKNRGVSCSFQMNFFMKRKP